MVNVAEEEEIPGCVLGGVLVGFTAWPVLPRTVSSRAGPGL